MSLVAWEPGENLIVPELLREADRINLKYKSMNSEKACAHLNNLVNRRQAIQEVDRILVQLITGGIINE